MSILFSLLFPARRLPGRGARALAFSLALLLAVLVVAIAGHHHDAGEAAHACAVCALAIDELPGPSSLPPIVPGTPAQSYLLLCVLACAGQYRRLALLPPSCGPPTILSRHPFHAAA